MDNHRILITGDFWHNDFHDVLSHIKVPTTLVPVEKLRSYQYSADEFQLIVMAQARRDQFSIEDIEFLQDRFPQVPLISLLGSWCEGESRSGHPLPGLIRIFWHQWQGRYDSFAAELNSAKISTWHLPRTAIPVDRVASRSANLAQQIAAIQFEENLVQVGVSAWTQEGFEMISDALRNFGFLCQWLERDTLDGIDRPSPDVLCIDANSLSANLQANISLQRSRFQDVPMVVLLNFPRKYESDAARELGVSEIVSKPFELIDLKFALERALNQTSPGDLKMHGSIRQSVD